MENLPEVYQNNVLVIYQTLIYQGKTTSRQIEAKPRREIALSRKRQELKETNYVSCWRSEWKAKSNRQDLMMRLLVFCMSLFSLNLTFYINKLIKTEAKSFIYKYKYILYVYMFICYLFLLCNVVISQMNTIKRDRNKYSIKYLNQSIQFALNQTVQFPSKQNFEQAIKS